MFGMLKRSGIPCILPIDEPCEFPSSAPSASNELNRPSMLTIIVVMPTTMPAIAGVKKDI